MANIQITETEAKEKKVKAIMALKFGLVEVGSLLYWRMLADREETV